MAQPGRSPGFCCPLQDGGGTAPREGLTAKVRDWVPTRFRPPHCSVGPRRFPILIQNNKRVTLVNVRVKGILEGNMRKVRYRGLKAGHAWWEQQTQV